MKRSIPLILVVIALLTLPHAAFACSTPTHPPGWNGSYKVVSPDGQYVLVMLDGVYEEPVAGAAPDIVEQNRLLSKYPASGLYRSDGSNNPLWTTGYISLQAEVAISLDGRHMVLWDKYPFYTETALVVYEDGRLLTGYALDNFVLEPEELPKPGIGTDWVASYSFDEKLRLLYLETTNKERYIISLHTGKIISSSIPTATVRKQAAKKRTIQKSGCPEASISTAAPMSTAVSNSDKPIYPPLPQGDYTLGLGLVISASTLAALFTGVSVLGGRARRKRLRECRAAPVTLPLRLKSRVRGRKGTLRRL